MGIEILYIAKNTYMCGHEKNLASTKSSMCMGIGTLYIAKKPPVCNYRDILQC